VASYALHHRHAPSECEAAFAAWAGFDSPLRRRPAESTCLTGDHTLVWRVEGESAVAALSLLPPFVRERTAVVTVRDVVIP
jgi:hypothetical protein